VETKTYQPVLSEGGRFGFKLRVNAVVSRDGKRHDIVMDEQQQWLRSQLEEMNLKSLGKKNELKNRLLDNADDSVLVSWRDLIASGPFVDKLGQTLGRQDTLDWAVKTIVEKRIQSWWCTKGERLGFEVARNIDGEFKLENTAYRKYALPEKAATAGYSSLDLSGEVVVRDVDKFRCLLFEGVGPSKAFGCGLMMIRRL
jgi:CRISPR system Cascade subunit CasE